MNIIFYEWKRNWTAAIKIALLCAVIVMVAIPFTLFVGEEGFVDQVRGALSMIPNGLMSAVGLYEGQSFVSHAQYLGFVHRFIFVVGGIFAAWLGGQFIAKERTEQTMDFLLAKPLKRWQILCYKILANVLVLVTTILLYRLFLFGVIKLYSIFNLTLDTSGFPMGKMLFALFAIQLFFFAVGCLISMVVPNGTLSVIISVAIALLFYFFEVADKSGSPLGALSIISPYHHLQAERLATAPGGAMVGFIFVALLLFAGSYAIFHHFDYRLKQKY